MKKKLLFFLKILTLTVASSFFVILSIKKSIKRKNMIKNFSIAGSFSGKDLKLSNDLKIHGGATIENSVIEGSLESKGGLNLDQSEVAKNVRAFGSAKINNSKILGSLETKGGLKLASSIVDKEANIFGGANIQDSKLNDKITIKGNLEFNSSTAEKPLTIYGNLISKNSTFKDKIIVNIKENFAFINNSFFKFIFSFFPAPTSYKLTFEDSYIKDIEINNNNCEVEVILQGKTIVNGDIIFKNGTGKVHVYDEAKVLGKIIDRKNEN